MEKKCGKLPVLIGFAAFEAYRFYKGRGVFNRLRFKAQHEAVSSYIEAHYPGSHYSEITETDGGWSCVVTAPEGKIVLYMTKTPDNVFVFWEKSM